jgi:tetratricopeptide (TPR) repeat protein
MKRRILFTIISIGLLGLMYLSARSVEDLSYKRYNLAVMYLPSSQFVGEVALGYKNLAADILWFKTIQYYGGFRMGENDLALFSHLVDVITDLDPQFVFAYIFGSMIIAEDLGYFEEGIMFLEKGIRNNPADWWLPFEMGFLYYVDAHDYESAARYFEQASRLPGAGEITRRFAAFMAAQAGHVETSIAMWEELQRTSDNQYIRELAQRYIEKLRIKLKEEGEG